METEYKYRLDDVSLIQEIIDDPMLDEYVDRDSLEKIRMHAVYFDTDDMDLSIEFDMRTIGLQQRLSGIITWRMDVIPEKNLI